MAETSDKLHECTHTSPTSARASDLSDHAVWLNRWQIALPPHFREIFSKVLKVIALSPKTSWTDQQRQIIAAYSQRSPDEVKRNPGLFRWLKMPLPRFDVHQKVGHFLMNGELDEEEEG